LLAAKLSGGMAARVLHQESGLDRLLSLVSAGYGILLMLKGGTGVRQEGVVFRAAIGYTAAESGQWRIPHTANRPGLCPLRLTGQVSLAGVSAAISAHSSQTTR
jgi:hypothetical protein